jgi:hypothetical protein
MQKCIAATTSARGAYCAALVGCMQLWDLACMADADDKNCWVPQLVKANLPDDCFCLAQDGKNLPRSGGMFYLAAGRYPAISLTKP